MFSTFCHFSKLVNGSPLLVHLLREDIGVLASIQKIYTKSLYVVIFLIYLLDIFQPNLSSILAISFQMCVHVCVQVHTNSCIVFSIFQLEKCYSSSLLPSFSQDHLIWYKLIGRQMKHNKHFFQSFNATFWNNEGRI